jgi:glycerophosphoryl diester phosphodiesterase
VTLVLAHRGANRRAPENTVEAFRAAIELGADGVELDVHATVDGHLVVRHDAETPIGLLAELTLAEVATRFPEVPTLDAALGACTGRLVNVEIKNLPHQPGFDPDERVAALVVELLAARRADRVIVSSFHLATVDRVHAAAPQLETAWLLANGDLATSTRVAAEHGHVAVHPHARLLGADAAEAIASAHAIGVRVHAWTVNEPDEILRLADAGVDAVITDVPDVAITALEERGLRAR